MKRSFFTVATHLCAKTCLLLFVFRAALFTSSLRRLRRRRAGKAAAGEPAAAPPPPLPEDDGFETIATALRSSSG
jgi:hypothetical protein